MTIVYPDEWTNFTGYWPPWEPSVPPMKIVKVIWFDAWGDDAQLVVDAVTDFEPIERRNVGYLIKDDEDKIILTQGIVENPYLEGLRIDGCVVIPKGMIKPVGGIEELTPITR